MFFEKEGNTLGLWNFGDTRNGAAINQADFNISTWAKVRGGKKVMGEHGEALRLNGAYGEFAEIPSLGNSKLITVEALVHILDFDLRKNCNAEDIVCRGRDSQKGNFGGFNLRAWRNDDGQLLGYTARKFKNTRFQFCMDGASTLQTRTFKPGWHWISGSYDGEYLRLAVNGRLEEEVKATDLATASTEPIFVNHHTWEGERSSNRMVIEVQEIKISNCAKK